MSSQQAIERWRLVLGRRSEEIDPEMRLSEGADLLSVLPAGVRLSDIDQALGFIYEGDRQGGTGDPTPYLADWMSQMRQLFREETLVMVQRDAFQRTGLGTFLLQPELLPHLQRDVSLVATFLSMKDQIPDTLKQAVREYIRETIMEIRRRLENEVRQTVIGAIQRNRHAPLRTYRNIDWRTTIRRNLKHYLPERRTVLPERLFFWANEKRFRDWQIIVLVDQSGSMMNSAIYASLMATIFASLSVLKTHLILFSTEVVDLTEYLNDDPVELLFSLQLGGGTDIAKAVRYGAGLVQQPEKCLFVLITDLYEGGDASAMLQHLSALKESKVHVLCLLALEEGKPVYDKVMAQKVANLGIPTFCATPKKLTEVIEQILKGAS